jgi:hypothetical protein
MTDSPSDNAKPAPHIDSGKIYASSAFCAPPAPGGRYATFRPAPSSGKTCRFVWRRDGSLVQRTASASADCRFAAVGLFVAHFNDCQLHESPRTTPAMARRLTDHVRTIGELSTACLDNAPAEPRNAHRRFTVIQEGKD